MIENFTSIKFIIEKLYRDLGETRELPFDDIVEWVHEALMFIGAFSQFEKKLTYVDISNYKGALPCDFYKAIQLSYNGYPIRYSGGSMDNTYHCTDCINLKCACEDYYYMNDSYIVTSFPTGTICLSYLSVPVDADGFPKIPDDVYFTNAVTKYVTYMLDKQQWRRSNLADKIYQESKMEWEWFTQAARSKANMPTLGQLESLKNILVRLKPLQNEYNQFFMNLGKQERRKLH